MITWVSATPLDNVVGIQQNMANPVQSKKICILNCMKIGDYESNCDGIVHKLKTISRWIFAINEIKIERERYCFRC